MRKIELKDLLYYIETEKCDREEALYLLNLYNAYKRHLNDYNDEMFNYINGNDILVSLRKLAKYYEVSNQNEMILRRLNAEIELMNKLDRCSSVDDLLNIYYETNRLLHYVDLDANNNDKDKIIELSLRLRFKDDYNK